MFARSAVRTLQSAQPFKQSIRRYATEPKPSGSGNTVLIASAAVAAGAGAWYFFSSNPGAAAKAEAKVKDAASSVTGAAAKAALTGGDQGFVSLKLDDVEIVNHNTKRFRFKLPEEDMVSGVTFTSAILTKYKPADAEKPVIRPYTPINDEDAKGYMDLLVKKYEGGPMSTHMHDMVPGQRLDVKGPLPKYPWTANKHDHIALIAGGTGITPMYQLCRAIFSNPADKTKVTLVFGNIAEEDVLLKQQLADLENTYPQRFRAFYVLEKPPSSWAGNKGYITKELLKTVLPEPKEENVKLFVCGPPPMMKAISGPKTSPKDQGDLVGILKDLGYSQDQVYKF
ncbi:uncharacterized protein E0L32_003321 [Thyridium curvatum]|uniref:NADH-cytochrome b5 reductase n=1 Tax=Thyridium curvatum TaxID=1093900 RepID=A0A507BCF3_9PEZI|nr:uncharacterized protein E0L32_003321 [Thyridium curvatum]TPX17203.1 hypothetical protein E0L32_003321 [Thyridium curvatum]